TPEHQDRPHKRRLELPGREPLLEVLVLRRVEGQREVRRIRVVVDMDGHPTGVLVLRGIEPHDAEHPLEVHPLLIDLKEHDRALLRLGGTRAGTAQRVVSGLSHGGQTAATGKCENPGNPGVSAARVRTGVRGLLGLRRGRAQPSTTDSSCCSSFGASSTGAAVWWPSPRNSSSGLATKIELYVLIRTPVSITNANRCTPSPPNA